ncbi:MAG: UDP-N-acetylmuramoyl-L-alanyl-D-glutamate--2,6-diaminopimelate ligase [Candidatus Zixiibacteriota bacterium]|nr:MAG: UDP-N-acetylmuramoyl-L-alanyl-D-glutamate--2,6-diaminopimelate ligase [candidate division Zixibacteria bacterium]
MNFAIMSDNERIYRSMNLSGLFEGLSVRLPGESGKLEINGITVDSRTVQPGNLFIAIPGHSQDGRQYISEAVSLGASAVLTASKKEIIAGVPIILTDDLKNIISAIANRYYDLPSEKIKVSGVTGTNGKTTTTYLIAGIFDSVGEKWGKIGTVGYDTGSRIVPAQNTTPGPVEIQKLLAEMADNGLDGCAMEVSSHALDQGRADGIRFHSATFTNLTQDHLDYHENMEKYFLAKAGLFENAACSVVNIDDDYGKKLLNLIKGDIVTYGFKQGADLECKALNTAIDSSLLEFKYKDRVSQFRFPLPGMFNHLNAAAAAATALAYGLSLDSACEGLSKATMVPGRMEAITLGQPFGVYVDYAHTPGALENLLNSIKYFKPDHMHVVFGCGGDRDVTKRPLMAEAVSRYADYVYLTSDNPRTEDPEKIIKDALPGISDKKRCKVIEDRALAIKAAITSAQKGDVVVIAGKGHEEYQIIGGVKKYFSDVEAAKSELRKLGYENNDRK